MREGARRRLLLLAAPGVLCISASLAGVSVAGEPPAPAEGSVALRFATVTAKLTPARVDPGGEGLLEVALVPAEGFAWHEADLRPSRVDIYPPAGWGAEPSAFACRGAKRASGPLRSTSADSPLPFARASSWRSFHPFTGFSQTRYSFSRALRSKLRAAL